jgi:hypothetical protein
LRQSFNHGSSNAQGLGLVVSLVPVGEDPLAPNVELPAGFCVGVQSL